MATDIIEINGTKIEVDLDGARRVEHFRVGDRVKLLLKSSYESAKVYPGVIVGFDAFPSLPTIVVAYLDLNYHSCELKFAYINTDTESKELVPMHSEEIQLDRADMVSSLDRQIEVKRAELEELERRKAYFLDKFGLYFEQATEAKGEEEGQ